MSFFCFGFFCQKKRRECLHLGSVHFPKNKYEDAGSGSKITPELRRARRRKQPQTPERSFIWVALNVLFVWVAIVSVAFWSAATGFFGAQAKKKGVERGKTKADINQPTVSAVSVGTGRFISAIGSSATGTDSELPLNFDLTKK